jgi:hypothetical protein
MVDVFGVHVRSSFTHVARDEQRVPEHKRRVDAPSGLLGSGTSKSVHCHRTLSYRRITVPPNAG